MLNRIYYFNTLILFNFFDYTNCLGLLYLFYCMTNTSIAGLNKLNSNISRLHCEESEVGEDSSYLKRLEEKINRQHSEEDNFFEDRNNSRADSMMMT